MGFLTNISSDFPVGNAAGWCKSIEEVQQLARSAAQFVVVGSITVVPRKGNPGTTFNGTSLNALGLPNPGIEAIRAMAPDIVHIAHDAGKPIMLSVAGFSPEEYWELTKAAQELQFDGAELNLSCPNVVDGDDRKVISSYDIPVLRSILERAVVPFTMQNRSFFTSIKMAPMSDPAQIHRTAELISAYDIDAVVTQNSFPNGLLFDDRGNPQIQTPDATGWGGFAGPAIKPMALGQVSQWKAALKKYRAFGPRIIGVGGVQCGADVRDMQRAGASLVQVGTTYFTGGAGVFSSIADEYFNL